MSTKNPSDLDLVPDLGGDVEAPTPLQMLRQQADVIERKTNREVRAVVENTPSGSTRVAYNLVLVVPHIGYRYKVLRVEFGIDGWPVDVSTPDAPTPVSANDEASYADRLRQIFATEGFRRAVSNMRALSREESSLTPAESAMLGVFVSFNVGADEYLPTMSLSLSVQKFPAPIRQDADTALEGLIKKGLVMQSAHADGFVLTKKGAEIAYKDA